MQKNKINAKKFAFHKKIESKSLKNRCFWKNA